MLTLRTELLDLALSLTGLKRGMLALPCSTDDDGSRRFKVKVKRNLESGRGTPEIKVLRNMLNRCLESRDSLIEGDIRHSGILGHAAREHELGAVVCLPLLSNGALLGAILLDDPSRSLPFSTAEEDLFRSFGRHVGSALSRMAKQTRAKRRMSTLQRRNERLEAQAGALVKTVKKQVGQSSARLRRIDRMSQEMRRLMGLDYTSAKRCFTRRYLSHVLRQTGSDLNRASEVTGLPLARLIGLLHHLEIHPRDL